jgi:hypothetical protein
LAPPRDEVDLARPEEVTTYLRLARPALIVNAAAFTAIDAAETDATMAMTVNGHIPSVLAEEAFDRNIGLVHFSTDLVFDGRRGADPVPPVPSAGTALLYSPCPRPPAVPMSTSPRTDSLSCAPSLRIPIGFARRARSIPHSAADRSLMPLELSCLRGSSNSKAVCARSRASCRRQWLQSPRHRKLAANDLATRAPGRRPPRF